MSCLKLRETAINKKWKNMLFLAAMFFATVSFAQENNSEHEFESTYVYMSVDIVTQYIWRGFDYGGFSIQPAIGIAWRGLSFVAYGSVGVDVEQTKTLGLALGYKWKGLSAKLGDFWYGDLFIADNKFPSRYFEYRAHNTTHVYEASLGYDFKYVALEWNTTFAGNDYYKSNGKRAYSTYVEVSAPFHIHAIDFKAHVGITPWEGYYSHGFNVVSTGVSATKTFDIDNKLAIAVLMQIIVNPYAEKAYVIAGISFRV
jgi:hypothetical protein